MSERSEPTTGTESDTGAEPNERLQAHEGSPPWARGAASGVGNGSDGASAAGTTGESGSEPADRADAVSSGSRSRVGDAPTSFMAAVPPRSGDPYVAAGRAGFDQPTVRTDKPAFEQPAQQEPASFPSRSSSARLPRRASLQLKRLDPWSVLKLSLVLSVAGFLIWLVAVGVLYGVLDGMGVWDQLNGTYSDLTAVNDPSGGPLISAGRVFGIAALIGAVNIVLFTALATVGSLIYNVASDLVGGAEVMLSERD